MILFSSNLKYLRESSGKKQGELASFLGVKANTISNYEQGISEPDFVLLEKIIEYFNISGYDLLFEDVKLGKSRNLKSDSDCNNKNALEMIRDLASENALLKKQNEELKRGDQRDARDADFVVAG
jgi:transcriptional regulator with XRE-family HTH domain